MCRLATYNFLSLFFLYSLFFAIFLSFCAFALLLIFFSIQIILLLLYLSFCLSNYQNKPLSSARIHITLLASWQLQPGYSGYEQRSNKFQQNCNYHSVCCFLFSISFPRWLQLAIHSFCGNLTQTCCYCRSFFIHFDNKLAALTQLYAALCAFRSTRASLSPVMEKYISFVHVFIYIFISI